MAIQLVIEYETGDGCTYAYTTAVPVVYDSAEAFIVDFEQACRTNKDTTGEIKIAGHTFYTYSFFDTYSEPLKKQAIPTFYPPRIMTIQEWFDYHN